MLTTIAAIIFAVYVVCILALGAMFIWVTCFCGDWNPADAADRDRDDTDNWPPGKLLPYQQRYADDVDSDLPLMNTAELHRERWLCRNSMRLASTHAAWDFDYRRHCAIESELRRRGEISFTTPIK